MKDVKIEQVIRILREQYPRAGTALRYRNPLELLIATILSARCTDKKVNEITGTLFSRYRTVDDFARVQQEVLEQEVRQAGFYRNKAKNIIASCKKIKEDFNGRVPDAMNELLLLPGVARKTANIVLSSAFNKAEGIAVDTHVRRLSQRLGLSENSDPDKIERDLMKIVPAGDWLDFNYLLVNHGREVCVARAPRCAMCCIPRYCSYYKHVNHPQCKREAM